MTERDASAPTIQYGYCTNVHAGPDLDQTRANLERYALAVKRQASPDAPMGVGLWLAAPAVRRLLADGLVGEWAAWLHAVGLVPFTLNGFPYGDFHERVVKHRVYHPTWGEDERLRYTLDLSAALDGLLPPGLEGSISTLPLAWGEPAPAAGELDRMAAALRQVAGELARRERETGRLIYLCLEPEPGCVLQRSLDVVAFFHDHLLRGHDEAPLRRHIRVCHDICHQAVMFEDQAEGLARYRAAGIRVGKVQVSSAVRLPAELTAADRAAALAQLAGFNEERYLHQTVVRRSPTADPVFHEDLPPALAAEQAGEWRVHFHVPIYLERFGRLEATSGAIREGLRAAAAHADAAHFEVETYAWGVLPPELQVPDLATGIARELDWFRATWTQNGRP
ncbi:MAG: metabolite traffic protein EboE [Gemmataceae bacterium]|nr:metabolite traffic protein EboE [Gemmataceae bacterium]